MSEKSSRWTLPGPFVPYLVVLAADAEAKQVSRRVPAEPVLAQLDNWAAVRGDILQEMELALREPTGSKEPPVPLSCKPGADQQLKSRLTALFQAQRLVVLTVDPAPQIPARPGSPSTPIPTRKVTYTFVFKTDSRLRLPYVVAIDGVVVGDARRTGFLRHNTPVTLDVPVGSTASLFLNSDAHPAHRRNPVYGVSPRERDVRITVTETTGTSVQPTEVPRYQDKDSKTQGRDVYTATLTGAIWMKVSYRYTEEDAQGLLPATTQAGLREAVLSIYRAEGLPASQKELTATCTLPPQGDPKSQPETRTLTLTFWGSSNPKDNIQDFVLQRDGLTRVHPGAFLAVLEAALKTGIQDLVITSNWRPMLGSIAHRLGLGLDVGAITGRGKAEITLNRAELREGSEAGALVSAKEKESFGQYLGAKAAVGPASVQLETATAAARKARDGWQQAKKTLADAQKAKKGVTPNPEALKPLLEKVEAAEKDMQAAIEAREKLLGIQQTAVASQGKALKAWRTELDADDPALTQSFRKALSAHPFVTQLYDPWYVDDNTRDKVEADPNEQCEGSVGWIHRNHLHITIAEPLLMD